MAEGVLTPDLKRYFDDARSWDQERLRAARKKERIAWTIGGVGAFAGIAGMAAVVALMPLKRLEVVTVRVNQTTGAVDVKTQLTGAQPVTYDEAVTKFFLAEYVRTRESWNPAAAAQNFNLIAILSDHAEQERWASFASPRNPNSPRSLWGVRAFVDARITSVTFINSHVAAVHYTRTVTAESNHVSTDWIATVTFSYTNAPMSEGDRFNNPLGFQVATYRADPVVTP